MDPRFLNAYNVELQHLRQRAAEFAEEYPKVAGRLSIDREGKDTCPDPFVERLLEGCAYLSARVQTKLEAEFPRFTQTLLETVYPHYLAPLPSMAIVRLDVNPQAGAMADGFKIERGTKLRNPLGKDDRTACEFRTGQDVTLWPIRIAEAEYFTRNLTTLELPRELGARAAIRIRLESPEPFQQLSLDRLNFFLRGSDEVPSNIYEQIFARGLGIAVRPAKSAQRHEYTLLPKANIRPVGFSPEESLLPLGPQGFSGYGLLREYFAFPQRFLFFDLQGLSKAVRACHTNALDVVIPLREPDLRLEERVDAGSFQLFSTPVINLFSKRTDRVEISNRFAEFHVVVDKTRPLDFEIYQIESVTAFSGSGTEEHEFKPFYRAQDSEAKTSAFYTTHRSPRVLTEKEKRRRHSSSYGGSEIFVSLVDASSAPYRSDLTQLGIRALCTNRHLPLQMSLDTGSSDFILEENAPVSGIRCVAGPTPPRPPSAEGAAAWKVISHLSLNYLSLADLEGGQGAAPLRELLNLYCTNDTHMKREVEGLVSVRSEPIVRRVDRPGLLAFARGLEITIRFNETYFEGSGVFVLAAVLEQFFARYVSLNSFTETVLETEQRGEIMRWPAQPGRKNLA